MSVSGKVTETPLKALLTAPTKPPVLNPWARYANGCLIGRVYNHPKLSDGKIIATSFVLELNEALGYARTLNTYYKLVNKRSAAEIKRLRSEMRKQ